MVRSPASSRTTKPVPPFQTSPGTALVAGGRRARKADATSSTDAFMVTRLHKVRSEEHTSELQSLMRISYAVFCLKKKKEYKKKTNTIVKHRTKSTKKSTNQNIAQHDDI